MHRLVFATSNAHKTQEVAAILGDGYEVTDLRAHPQITLPEETGATFEANALIKARAASAAIPGALVLADDSGLEVDALAGAPGVWSARYAGINATDKDNRARLKVELSLLEGGVFTGRFHCCMALVRDGHLLKVAHGKIEGRLLLNEQGSGGFGYDSLFVPEGFAESFGTLPESVKNTLSHRARALEEIRAWLEGQLEGA